jgi:hypothetical protein
MFKLIHSAIKKHYLFICVFGSLYLALLHPLLGLEQGFVAGDYDLQFYPWTHLYAEHLRQGSLLLWTPLIQSGFYCFAEGQVGMLYLINILLFRWLDFNLAWNLVILIHFLIGGLGAYVYGLKIRCSKSGSTIIAILFCFGSAYAGCFYNVVTLRTLAWFPLMLFFTERMVKSRCWLSGFALAFILSQSWLGGFSQVAAYANGFVTLYYLYRIIESQDRDMLKHFFFVLMQGLALLIAVPQLWATLELAGHSTRTMQSPEFALWGSFAPWSALTMLAYTWRSFLRSGIYIGIVPLIMILCTPWKHFNKACLGLLALSIFLALGSFNPLYHLAIELPIMSLLRNPSKFLFFSSFFFACLAGMSWDYFFNIDKSELKDKSNKIRSRILVWTLISLALMYFVWFVAHFCANVLIEYGTWYANHFVIGKSFHRHDVDHYYQKVQFILENIQGVVSMRDLFFWIPQIFLISFLCLFWRIKRHANKPKILKIATLLLIVTDIFIYGASGYGTGFLGNLGTFRSIAPTLEYPKDAKWIDTRSENESLLMPNRNILSRHPTLGAYTPILDLAYYELFGWTGQLDDSVGRSEPDLDDFDKYQNLLNFAGVKYYLSESHQPQAPFLNQGIAKEPYFINPNTMSEYTWVTQTQVIPDSKNRLEYLFSPKFDPTQVVVIEEAEYALPVPPQMTLNTRKFKLDAIGEEIRLQAPQAGVFVRNQLYDKGWKASLNGREIDIMRVNHAFQGIAIPSGEHIIRLYFKPVSFIIGRWFMILGYFLLLTGVIAVIWRGKYEKTI